MSHVHNKISNSSYDVNSGLQQCARLEPEMLCCGWWCILRTKEVETGGSLRIQGQLDLHSKLQSSLGYIRRSSLKQTHEQNKIKIIYTIHRDLSSIYICPS